MAKRDTPGLLDNIFIALFVLAQKSGAPLPAAEERGVSSGRDREKMQEARRLAAETLRAIVELEE